MDGSVDRRERETDRQTDRQRQREKQTDRKGGGGILALNDRHTDRMIDWLETHIGE